MALNGKYVSIKEIAERVYGDTGIEKEIIWEDIIRWSVQALNKVNHPLQYRRKVTGHISNPNLDIENYRALLPCNIHSIEQVLVNGCPARYSGDSFHHLLSGECCGLESTQPFGNTSEISEGFYIDGFGNEFLAGFPNQTYSEVTYDLNDEYITLSCKEGQVCIAYLEIPTDDEGFPMVPEHESYQEAISKYITMKMDYINYRKDPSNQAKRMLYEDSKKEWAWYVGQAGTAAKGLSIDQMEGLKNQMVRTFHNFNHHSSTFRNLGTSQKRNIK